MNSSLSFDLVILGGGLAGLAAGSRALQLGLTAAIVEQGDGDSYPCNSRYSGGVLHVAFRNVKADPAELVAAMVAANDGATDPELLAALAASSARSVDWIRDEGARFIRVGQVDWQQWMLAPPRPLTAGLDWKGRGPDVTLRTLLENFRTRGGRLVNNAVGTGLVVRDGRCVGLEATIDGVHTALMGSVLIADGGFQANLDLLRGHVSPAPEKLMQRGAGNARGAGLRMAQAIGAQVSDLSTFYGHLLSQDARSNPRLWPYPVLDELATSGVIVDSAGVRVLDEGLGGVNIANHIARRADPLDCVVVFDDEIWKTTGTAARIPANPNLERAGATFVKANTIGALATQLQMPVDALVNTIAQFNAAIAANATASLSPPRTAAKIRPLPIARAPFYALPVCAGITHTTGGLLADAHARVRRAGGGTIDGLHVAGSAMGGIEGGPKAGYVGGLMKALVFGLIAAEDVAATRTPA